MMLNLNIQKLGIHGRSQNLTLKGIKASVSSYTGSVAYLKKIFPLCVCNIVHNRIDYDPKYFKDQNVAGMEFVTFMPHTKNHTTADIYWWTKGAVQAIEKKYLKEMYLYFKDNASNDIDEHYKFSFQYVEKENVVPVPADDIIGTTNRLFDVIRSMSSTKKLSAETEVLIELTYFENVTPVEYVPEYYFPHDWDSSIPLMYQVAKDANTMTIANLRTGYHVMKCVAAGKLLTGTCNSGEDEVDVVEEEENDIDEQEEDQPVEVEQHQQLFVQKEEVGLSDADTLDFEQGRAGPTRAAQKGDTVLSISDDEDYQLADAMPTNQEMSENAALNCLCGLNFTVSQTDEIACTVCTTYQHTVCVGYTSSVLIPKPYICVQCGTDQRPSTDGILSKQKVSQRPLVSALRLVLWYCHKTMKYPVNFFEYFEDDVRRKLHRNLRQDKCMKIAEDNSVTLDFLLFVQKMKLMFYEYTIPDSMTLGDESQQDQI